MIMIMIMVYVQDIEGQGWDWGSGEGQEIRKQEERREEYGLRIQEVEQGRVRLCWGVQEKGLDDCIFS